MASTLIRTKQSTLIKVGNVLLWSLLNYFQSNILAVNIDEVETFLSMNIDETEYYITFNLE